MTQRVAEVKRPHLTLSRPPEAGILIWHFITLIAIAIFAQLLFLQSFALAAASSEDPAKDTVDASSALPYSGTIESWISSELHPMSDKWYTNPWPETDIRYRLTKQPPLEWKSRKSMGTATETILIAPSITYQTILGIGSSLEHTSIYAIRKNKTRSQQRALLESLISPDEGIGMNLFRIEIGTSDFSDGTKASPVPLYEKGWFSLKDSPNAPFSIDRPLSLGIIDTVKMAIEVGEATENPIKIFASPWSPPDWMRAKKSMVQGGPIKRSMLDDYAAYLRQFVEAYAAEGIPVYAITLQNERLFEPTDYPGMVISWELERDLLVEVHKNFRSGDGRYGKPLDVKIWALDHNFDHWREAELLIKDLKANNQAHILDGIAFHHYGGLSKHMAALQSLHPNIPVMFTEGSVWGLNGDKNRRGFETVIQHLRNGATTYNAWVTMITQNPAEANQGPYNRVGKVAPTMLIQEDGSSSESYKTPEFWLMGQFSRFVRPGAVRIHSNYGSIQTVTNVAFLNLDGTYALIVANSTSKRQTFSVEFSNQRFSARIPPKSIATYRWTE